METSKTERFFRHPLGIILSATAASLLWGSAYPAIKLSYAALHIGKEDIFKQLLFAGYRFVAAALIIQLLIFIVYRNFGIEKGKTAKVTKIAVFQTFLQYVFFYIGLSYSTGVQGSIIAGTTSFFQLLLAHFMYKNDHFSVRKTIGLLLGFAGIVVACLSGTTLQLSFGFGEICLLASAFFGAYGNVLTKQESARMNVFALTSQQMLLGGLGLVVAGAVRTGLLPFQFTTYTLLMLLYLAILSASAFMLWNNVMKYNKVGSVSMYLFLIPVFGVILSSTFLGETVHLTVVLALSLVVAGIIIVNRQSKSKASASSNAAVINQR